jgi:uncharacterized protein (TIGR03000 family)
MSRIHAGLLGAILACILLFAQASPAQAQRVRISGGVYSGSPGFYYGGYGGPRVSVGVTYGAPYAYRYYDPLYGYGRSSFAYRSYGIYGPNAVYAGPGWSAYNGVYLSYPSYIYRDRIGYLDPLDDLSYTYQRPVVPATRFPVDGTYRYDDAAVRSLLRRTTTAGRGPARIQVTVPDADAEIWFEDHKTAGKGTTRSFESPALTPGKSYTYRLRATWNEGGQTVTDERDVEVSAGQTARVEFARKAEKPPAPAPAKSELPP